MEYVTLNNGVEMPIIGYGVNKLEKEETERCVLDALKACDILKEEGINARVINIHTIKPIDEEIILKAAKETGAIVTAEEHYVMGGLGSAVTEVVCAGYPVPVKIVGTDRFGASGKPDELMKAYGLTAENIAAQAITP